MATKKEECLFCGSSLEVTFSNLGTSPLCEEFVKPERLNSSQLIYPLHAYVCHNCYLVQVHEYVTPEEIYSDYYYFSSYSDSWLEHAKNYVDTVTDRFGLHKESFVVEIASNDGYLLQYFIEKDIPVLGVEPSVNVARESIAKGIPTEQLFFGEKTAHQLSTAHRKADLILGNNVLAHVPDINDFVKGLKHLLSDKGVMTFEFPHLMQLIENNQFDTIYHEHFFYYSLFVVKRIFETQGLKLFDVEELSTHGGSLRIHATHIENGDQKEGERLDALLTIERNKGYTELELYREFDNRVKKTKRDLLKLLIKLAEDGKKVAGYGAPGKGNTLLNYCGIYTDLIEYTVDRNPKKQGMYLPGSLIPIFHPDKIRETKPDFVFILPWNFKDEIMSQMKDIAEWGGKFIIPIPVPIIVG